MIRPLPPRARRVFAAILALVTVNARSAIAQGAPDAARPLATRSELEAIVASAPSETAGGAGKADAERRLREGDFRVGDLILLSVQGEVALSDTFAVTPEGALLLPSPATGAFAVVGLLRSELEPRLKAHLARFLRDPIVRARPLLRVAITGQVVRAGFYAVPLDAPIADALMAADGVAPTGDLAKLTLTRNGRTIIAPRRMRELLARGTTLDQARLREGDELEVGRGHEGWEDRLRFLWVIISVAGGLYGISQGF